MNQKGILSCAKILTQESLNPIADHRPTHLCADRNAESINSPIVGFADDDEVGSVDFPPSAREAEELGAFGKAGPLGEFFPALQQFSAPF